MLNCGHHSDVGAAQRAYAHAAWLLVSIRRT
jgi:hypothetical protein